MLLVVRPGAPVASLLLVGPSTHVKLHHNSAGIVPTLAEATRPCRFGTPNSKLPSPPHPTRPVLQVDGAVTGGVQASVFRAQRAASHTSYTSYTPHQLHQALKEGAHLADFGRLFVWFACGRDRASAGRAASRADESVKRWFSFASVGSSVLATSKARSPIRSVLAPFVAMPGAPSSFLSIHVGSHKDESNVYDLLADLAARNQMQPPCSFTVPSSCRGQSPSACIRRWNISEAMTAEPTNQIDGKLFFFQSRNNSGSALYSGVQDLELSPTQQSDSPISRRPGSYEATKLVGKPGLCLYARSSSITAVRIVCCTKT